MNKAKMKQVAFIGGVALLTMLVVNTVANRVPAVANVRNKINTGL